MEFVSDVAELETIYGTPGEASVIKVMDHITPGYRAWLERSRICILSTVGPEGTDASPRGDKSPPLRVIDPQTLALPDWRGNNRIDSLRNIVRDPRVSVMAFVHGSNNVVRINGTAQITVDPDFVASFVQEGKSPRSVAVISVKEVYSQCARALMRGALWDGHDRSQGLPSIGDLLKEAKEGFDAATYDQEWAGRAAKTMW